MSIKFPFNLIDKLTMAFLTGQSWCILKSWYAGGGLKQGFQCCFVDGLNQSLVSSVMQAYSYLKTGWQDSSKIVSPVSRPSMFVLRLGKQSGPTCTTKVINVKLIIIIIIIIIIIKDKRSLSVIFVALCRKL